MNITLSGDDRIADEARRAASAMGKSLTQAVRDYLEQLARAQQLQEQLDAVEVSAVATPGRLRSWEFGREEANRRAWASSTPVCSATPMRLTNRPSSSGPSN